MKKLDSVLSTFQQNTIFSYYLHWDLFHWRFSCAFCDYYSKNSVYLKLFRLMKHINVIPFLFPIPLSCCAARIRFSTEHICQLSAYFFTLSIPFCWWSSSSLLWAFSEIKTVNTSKCILENEMFELVVFSVLFQLLLTIHTNMEKRLRNMYFSND